MMSEDPTITPIAWPTLSPSASRVDPAVHAELLAPGGKIQPQHSELMRTTLPVMIQYPAKPCQVHVLRSSGIGIRSRLHHYSQSVRKEPMGVNSTHIGVLIVSIVVDWAFQLRRPVRYSIFSLLGHHLLGNSR
jgi:hypothetical protein